MLENVYEGLNARPKVYSSKEYFCKMYPCVSSKLCEFIYLEDNEILIARPDHVWIMWCLLHMPRHPRIRSLKNCVIAFSIVIIKN